jgi:type IV pilus assembly protein PilY1
MLTDGAPNQNLRPACQGGAGDPNCPYPKDAAETARTLFLGGTGKKVTTFVIGFSVNGTGLFPTDGFPASWGGYGTPTAVKTCKAWYADPSQGNNNPATMDSVCTATAPPAGSTADACCQLNKIAYNGSGGPSPGAIGAFFAESQADLVLAFSRILASVTKTAATRTIPAPSPTSQTSVAGQEATASFVAEFVPSTRKVWSGEIDRTRSICSGVTPTPQTQDASKGDSYAYNLASQAVAGKRWFMTAIGQAVGSRPAAPISNGATAIDSARTMRPYATVDEGLGTYKGAEDADLDDGLKSRAGFASALDIDDRSCKHTRLVTPGNPPQNANVPALLTNDCRDVIWDFATAHSGSVNKTGTDGTSFDFNVRCTGGQVAQGTCSISGATCQVDNPTACNVGTVEGEVCVPQCTALGAIFRSSPVVIGPPDGFLRDDGYRLFQAAHATRKPTMFVATTDGVLHAFKALDKTIDAGSDPTSSSSYYEFWAFVPPAVLPKLASNFPGGQQILLDGSPVVKETVWDRVQAGLNLPDQWHTTLVASLGASGAGYYAMNVTDADCAGNACTSTTAEKATSLAEAAGTKKGPHFLWQITDVPRDPSDTIPSRRTSLGDNQQFVPLFGNQTGTPAIATLQVKQGSAEHQLGVAVLPGGIDGPPQATGTCPRAIAGGYGSFPAANFDLSDSLFPARTSVRNWTSTPGSCTGPVAGRGVTLVRLDNGQVLRHFGRKTQDVPVKLRNVTTDSPFDSPMIGTPAVYPATVGTTTQKIFIGDADGAIWRIDVSQVCDLDDMSNCKWNAQLLQDTLATNIDTGTLASQPVSVPLALSQSPTGRIVVNAATGDQENFVATTDKNVVVSIEEPPTSGKSVLHWVNLLTNGERVTGPMAVLDRTLYFATFQPAPSGSVCTAASQVAKLWGLDYITPATATPSPDPKTGGAPRWCPIASTLGLTGACNVAPVSFESSATNPADIPNTHIPGVLLQASQSCAETGVVGDDYLSGVTGVSASSYQLFFSFGKARGGSNPLGTNQVERKAVPRSVPRISTSIDAWAYVLD